MSRSTDRLLKEALRLPQNERAKLVTELLATLEPDVPAERRTDEEWIAEIERRARVALEGRPSVSWVDARRRIQKRLSGE